MRDRDPEADGRAQRRRVPRRNASSIASASTSATCSIDGDDILGDGVNIAARLEGICEPGGDLHLPAPPTIMCAAGSTRSLSTLARRQLKNIERPIRVYSLRVGVPAQAKPATHLSARSRPSRNSARRSLPLIAGIVALIVIAGGALVFPRRQTARHVCARSPRPRRRRPRPRISPSSCCPSPTSPATRPKTISPTA